MTDQPYDWENPEMVGRNKLPAHATLTPYPDAATALVADRDVSPFVQSLDGPWRFVYGVDPAMMIDRVAAGGLDPDLQLRPSSHIFVGSKASWFEIGDDLPQHSADSD